MSLALLTSYAHALARDSRHGPSVPPLVLITDRYKIPNIFTVIAHLPAGTLVIIRDYDHPHRAQYAAHIAALCRKRHCHFLIANDPHLAMRLRADGIHLPEHRIHIANTWKLRQPRWFITTSVHSIDAALIACRQYVDAVIACPVFASSSHPQTIPLGPELLKELVRQSSLPVYALGGINAETITQLRGTGIGGIAAIDAFRHK